MNHKNQGLVIFDGLNIICQHGSFNRTELIKAALNSVQATLDYLDPCDTILERRLIPIFVWDPMALKREPTTEHQGTKSKAYRKDLFAEYKPARRAYPAKIVEAREAVEDFKVELASRGISSICQPGLEADDYIAFIAKMHSPQQTIIVSEDNDFNQLICSHVSVFKNSGWIDHNNFTKKLGLPIEKYLLWKAANGDPSDNIPGLFSGSKAWLWAIQGAKKDSLTTDELLTLERNLKLTRLDLWARKNCIPVATWREAQKQYLTCVTKRHGSNCN